VYFKRKNKSGISPAKISWRKFRTSKIALASLIWIMLNMVLAIAGYLITPDSTPFANNQQLEIRTHYPGTTINMLLVKKNQPEKKCSFFEKMLYGCEASSTSYPFSTFEISESEVNILSYSGSQDTPGLERSFNLADILFAINVDSAVYLKNDSLHFTSYSGNHVSAALIELQNEIRKNHIVTKSYLLGTDQFGRDLLSQLIIGTRVSLSVGLIAVLISLLIGVTLGSIGGFFRGRIDDFIIWLINIIWSVPTLILVIAITFAIGKGFWQVFIAVGLTMWVDVARVTRGQIISLREKEFVEAARALGINTYRIITKHILPNIYGPLIVISAANFASAILIEAGLSFLGMGVQPPIPSWGSMIKENYGYIILDKAYLAILPGLAIMLMVLSFLLAGNSLRDALDKTNSN